MFVYAALCMSILQSTCHLAEIWQQPCNGLALTSQIQLAQRHMYKRVLHDKRGCVIDSNIKEAENRWVEQLYQSVTRLEKGAALFHSQSCGKCLNHKLFGRMLYVFAKVGTGKTTLLDRAEDAILAPTLYRGDRHIWVFLHFVHHCLAPYLISHL